MYVFDGKQDKTNKNCEHCVKLHFIEPNAFSSIYFSVPICRHVTKKKYERWATISTFSSKIGIAREFCVGVPAGQFYVFVEPIKIMNVNQCNVVGKFLYLQPNFHAKSKILISAKFLLNEDSFLANIQIFCFVFFFFHFWKFKIWKVFLLTLTISSTLIVIVTNEWHLCNFVQIIGPPAMRWSLNGWSR